LYTHHAAQDADFSFAAGGGSAKPSEREVVFVPKNNVLPIYSTDAESRPSTKTSAQDDSRQWLAADEKKNVGVAATEWRAAAADAEAAEQVDGAAAADQESLAMVRSLFGRFSRGQELLRRNHGVPVLHQQAVLDQFIDYLNVACRVPAETTELLSRMRQGALMNSAGGTSGGRLQMTLACLCKEPAFVERVTETFFRASPTSRLELFPSTTKSVEAFVSLLAREAETRERPIKLLLPSDAHYAWSKVCEAYDRHPYLRTVPLDVGDGSLGATRLRPGDTLVAIFTLANTVSGRATEPDWFAQQLGAAAAAGADVKVFVDAALSGCCVARDSLGHRAESPQAVSAILDSSIGLVQSTFKDYGLSSMLFLDDAWLECCQDLEGDRGLAAKVAGGSHALIRYAPVTSIPESPTLPFLLFAREYTRFRLESFDAFAAKLRAAIPPGVAYELRPLFPLLHVDFADEAVAADLARDLVATYSLITIDAEPTVLRLWPTPTNHDVADAIGEWFRRRRG